jgi:hypothetical protein
VEGEPERGSGCQATATAFGRSASEHAHALVKQGRILGNNVTDVAEHFVQVVHHRIGGDSNNPDPTLSKHFCAELVLLLLVLMMRPVDFYGLLDGGTLEVRDVAGDDVLAAELQSVQLASPQA